MQRSQGQFLRRRVRVSADAEAGARCQIVPGEEQAVTIAEYGGEDAADEP